MPHEWKGKDGEEDVFYQVREDGQFFYRYPDEPAGYWRQAAVSGIREEIGAEMLRLAEAVAAERERCAVVCEAAAVEADTKARAAVGSTWLFAEHSSVRVALREAAAHIRRAE